MMSRIAFYRGLRPEFPAAPPINPGVAFGYLAILAGAIGFWCVVGCGIMAVLRWI